MRAIIIKQPGEPEVLLQADISTPTICMETDMLVRVLAAGVNPIDTKLRSRGTYFPDDMPAILGCDGAGTVEAIGAGVKHFKPGDAVYYCYGGIGQKDTGNYAEYALIDSNFAAKKPESIDFNHAAAAPLVLITAWESLFDRAHLQSNQRVLIHAGAGGVGHVAIQLAKIAGAEVATTISTPEKAEFVKTLGADLIINYREQNFADAVLEWTGGGGVDVVFDTVGGNTFKQSIPATRFYGDIVTILQIPDNTDWKTARLRNLRISQELMLSPMLYGLHDAGAHHAAILEQCAQLIDEGKLMIYIDEILPLEEAAEAHRLIERGEIAGKIVLSIS